MVGTETTAEKGQAIGECPPAAEMDVEHLQEFVERGFGMMVGMRFATIDFPPPEDRA